MAKKPALGRGLSAILGDVEELYEKELGSDISIKEAVLISKIKPNPKQPRKSFKEESIKELAASIKEYGLIQPVLLHDNKDGSYILVAGERRLRACVSLGFESIKAVIGSDFKQNLAELALIENIQREDLNPLDLAKAFKYLLDKHKLTQEELASLVHKSRSEVANILRILSLDDDTKALISKGVLSKAHAKIIAGAKNKKEEDFLSKKIIKEKLSVRKSEELAKSLKNKNKENEFELLEEVANKLKEFGLSNKIKSNKISIVFKNKEQVKDFLSKL